MDATQSSPAQGPIDGFHGFKSFNSQSLLMLCWQKYIQQLNKQPLPTKCITSACVAGLSDIVAQFIISGSYKSWKRTFAVACYGGLYTGPAAHYWQKLMEYMSSGRKDMNAVALKVLVEQLTFGPVCNVLFMSFAGLFLEGLSGSAVMRKVVNDYPGVQLNGWRLWPLAALINYRFVPLQFRVLFINVVAFIWTVFLLLKAKRAQRLVALVKPAAA